MTFIYKIRNPIIPLKQQSFMQTKKLTHLSGAIGQVKYGTVPIHLFASECYFTMTVGGNLVISA